MCLARLSCQGGGSQLSTRAALLPEKPPLNPNVKVCKVCGWLHHSLPKEKDHKCFKQAVCFVLRAVKLLCVLCVCVVSVVCLCVWVLCVFACCVCFSCVVAKKENGEFAAPRCKKPCGKLATKNSRYNPNHHVTATVTLVFEFFESPKMLFCHKNEIIKLKCIAQLVRVPTTTPDNAPAQYSVKYQCETTSQESPQCRYQHSNLQTQRRNQS